MSQLTIFGTVEDDAKPPEGRQLALTVGTALEARPADVALVPGLFGVAPEAGDEQWQRDTAAFAAKPRQSLAAFKREWRNRMFGLTSPPPRARNVRRTGR